MPKISARKFFFLISMFLFLAFVYFSFLVSKERFTQFDFDTTVKVQNHISQRFDLPFSLLSPLGSAEVTGIIWLALLIFVLLRRFWLTFLSLFLFPAITSLEIFGKLFVLHPGPPFLFYRGVLNFNFPSSYVHTDYSYPSGHMTRISFLVAFFLLWLFLKAPWAKRLVFQVGLIVFWGLMFISRIYLAEHWTTDVIGGTLLGTAAGIFTAVTLPSRRKEVLSPSHS